MKQHKNRIIAGIIVVVVLAFAFWYGGDAPGFRGWTSDSEENVATVQNNEPSKDKIKQAEKTDSEILTNEETESDTEENKLQKQEETPMTAAEKSAMAEKFAEDTQDSAEEISPSEKVNKNDEECSNEQEDDVNEVAEKDQYRTDPVPEGKPLPVEPENAVINDKEYTCTLSVRCDTILNNINWLDSEKIKFVPKDGTIFAGRDVVFYEGESVFNVLVREMKRNKIHIEYEMSPIYETAYIKGIANIYEFDCGDLSGWLYKVNGQVPNVGCSLYYLNDGDVVELVYTCEMGKDLE